MTVYTEIVQLPKFRIDELRADLRCEARADRSGQQSTNLKIRAREHCDKTPEGLKCRSWNCPKRSGAVAKPAEIADVYTPKLDYGAVDFVAVTHSRFSRCTEGLQVPKKTASKFPLTVTGHPDQRILGSIRDQLPRVVNQTNAGAHNRESHRLSSFRGFKLEIFVKRLMKSLQVVGTDREGHGINLPGLRHSFELEFARQRLIEDLPATKTLSGPTEAHNDRWARTALTVRRVTTSAELEWRGAAWNFGDLNHAEKWNEVLLEVRNFPRAM
ncbi:hypothetical protein B0H14DRAFT_2596522 [Mycena olivaceomarginata]|nr:hypothetical protein B0H14DRAFT_2596522 [Mycena olivaceomarginata]